MVVRALPLILLAALAGCEPPLVLWGDPHAIAEMQGPSRLVVDPTGSVRFVPDTVRPATTPSVPGLCATTLRTASGRSLLFASWWNVRADSSAVLLVARSSDAGRGWLTPVAVDTTDVGTSGCDRPAPALATVGDDVYVAYSMIAPEGKGVFFAHSMGSMLHAPVPVIYGERLVATAIAAEDQRVAVAYEEPNGSRQQIDVALSATQGHLFDWHETASRGIDAATSPAVALSGPELAVSWSNAQPTGPGTRVVRVGRIQKPGS